MKIKNSIKRTISLGLACLIMAVTLAGCGSSGNDENAYVGKWELTGMTTDGQDYSDYLSILGDFSLDLGADGKINSWTFFGQDLIETYGIDRISWKIEGDKAILQDETDSYEMSIKDGNLVLEFDGSVLTFEKSGSGSKTD